jgi:hypothetical protein
MLSAALLDTFPSFPSFIVSFADLSPLLSSLLDPCFSALCALVCRLSALLCSFGAPSGLGLAAFLLPCLTLLCCLSALGRLGFAFGFLLSRSYAGIGGRADAGNQMEAIAVHNLFADGVRTLDCRSLATVIVLAAEIDFPPVGRPGMSGRVPTRLPGPASAPSAAG